MFNISNDSLFLTKTAQLWHSYIPGYDSVQFIIRAPGDGRRNIFTNEGWKEDDKAVDKNYCYIPFGFVNAFIEKISKEINLSPTQSKKLNDFLFKEQLYELESLESKKKEKKTDKITSFLVHIASNYLKSKDVRWINYGK